MLTLPFKVCRYTICIVSLFSLQLLLVVVCVDMRALYGRGTEKNRLIIPGYVMNAVLCIILISNVFVCMFNMLFHV